MKRKEKKEEKNKNKKLFYLVALITVSSSPPLFSGNKKQALALPKLARFASRSLNTSPDKYVTLASYNQFDFNQR